MEKTKSNISPLDTGLFDSKNNIIGNPTSIYIELAFIKLIKRFLGGFGYLSLTFSVILIISTYNFLSSEYDATATKNNVSQPIINICSPITLFIIITFAIIRWYGDYLGKRQVELETYLSNIKTKFTKAEIAKIFEAQGEEV